MLLGLLAFASGIDTPFVLDDEPAITENPRILRLWPFGDAGYAVQSTEAGRPVVRFTLALNHALGELELGESGLAGAARALGTGAGGLNVRGYHLFNMLVQVLSALALLGLVRRTLVRCADRAPELARAAFPLAWLTAALWLVHPLQTDAVTYVIQRTELLMGLFYLLTLYAAVRALDGPRGTAWMAASVVACLLGMGCKEAMASAPLAVLLWDRAFAFPDVRTALARRWPLYLGLVLSWIPLAFLVHAGPRDQTVGFALGVAWWRYGATQLGLILHYLRLSFWPSGLCLDYGRRLASGAAEIVPGALVVGALGLATLWALAKRPRLGFAGAWFFLILAPSSSIVPIVTEVGAERRMHLPLAAVLVLVVLGAFAIGQRWMRAAPANRTRGVAATAMALGLAAVLALAAVSSRRNQDFRSALSIWEDTVAKRPDNPGARNNLGRALAYAGRLEEALVQFDAAVRLPDCGADAFDNLGMTLIDLGRLDQAVQFFTGLIRDQPTHVASHQGLARAYLMQERWVEAVAEYRTAIALGRDNAALRNDLGRALYRLGRTAEALEEIRTALRLDPDHPVAAENLRMLEEQLRVKRPAPRR